MFLAGGYNGAFYTQSRVQIGVFTGGYPVVQNTQIINNNNINIINNVPAREVTPLAAPVSSIIGQEGALHYHPSSPACIFSCALKDIFPMTL